MYRELAHREAHCKQITLKDRQLGPVCVFVEEGLSAMEDTCRELVLRAKGGGQETALMVIFTWTLHQLYSAYDNALKGNYPAGVTNGRSGLEGVFFMEKYAGDRVAAAKWANDLEYANDKPFAILTELGKKRGVNFRQLHEHYRNLSKLSHPYPKVRFMFIEKQKEKLGVSASGSFKQQWAAALLGGVLFVIGNSLEIISPFTAKPAVFLNRYRAFAPAVFRRLAEVKK